MKRICLAVVVFALAGCQTQQQGAVLTPVAPAVSPQQPAPPIAAAVSAGPLTRAAVETYMDAQEGDLRSYLRGQGVLLGLEQEITKRAGPLARTGYEQAEFDVIQHRQP